MLVLFGLEFGPLAALRDCPAHPGTHASEVGEQLHDLWLPSQSTGDHGNHGLSSDGDTHEAAESSGPHSDPCGCLDSCVPGFDAPPPHSQTAAQDVLPVRLSAQRSFESLLAPDPAAFLTPEAIPPPA